VRRRGEPSRIPWRGAAALLVTAGGLALLFSFRVPEGDVLGGVGLLGGSSDPAVFAVDGASPFASAVASDAPTAPTPAPTHKVVLGPPAPGQTPAPTDAPLPTEAPAPSQAAAPVVTPKPGKVASAKQVVDGQVARTPYGNVQVEVTIQGGKLVDITALQLPDGDRHSRQISNIVGPMLHDDAVQLANGKIHGVSGATYTSMGYARSLQSAMDQAGI
jgi:uncharacterized protein with FMN-binding domain